MNSDQKEYIRQWLYKANEDIAVVRQLTVDHPELYTGAICYHAQQAVEKYFKAFLVYHNVDFKKVHDLDYLLLLCMKIEPADFESVNLESLNDYGVSVRYPDDFIIPTPEETSVYHEIAEKVREIVLKRLIIE